MARTDARLQLGPAGLPTDTPGGADLFTHGSGVPATLQCASRRQPSHSDPAATLASPVMCRNPCPFGHCHLAHQGRTIVTNE
jgi:hypothetical protein